MSIYATRCVYRPKYQVLRSRVAPISALAVLISDYNHLQTTNNWLCSDQIKIAFDILVYKISSQIYLIKTNEDSSNKNPHL